MLVFRISPIFFLDREHLFFSFTLPYSRAFSCRSAGARTIAAQSSACIGLLAAIGLARLYCLAVLSAQLSMPTKRSARILISVENMVIYALSVIYVLCIAWLTPEYISTVMPMALVTYAATRDPASVLDYSANALSALFLTFLLFNWRATSVFRRDIYYLALLCPFFLCYALLNNNQPYTFIPGREQHDAHSRRLRGVGIPGAAKAKHHIGCALKNGARRRVPVCARHHHPYRYYAQLLLAFLYRAALRTP